MISLVARCANPIKRFRQIGLLAPLIQITSPAYRPPTVNLQIESNYLRKGKFVLLRRDLLLRISHGIWNRRYTLMETHLYPFLPPRQVALELSLVPGDTYTQP